MTPHQELSSSMHYLTPLTPELIDGPIHNSKNHRWRRSRSRHCEHISQNTLLPLRFEIHVTFYFCLRRIATILCLGQIAYARTTWSDRRFDAAAFVVPKSTTTTNDCTQLYAMSSSDLKKSRRLLKTRSNRDGSASAGDGASDNSPGDGSTLEKKESVVTRLKRAATRAAAARVAAEAKMKETMSKEQVEERTNMKSTEVELTSTRVRRQQQQQQGKLVDGGASPTTTKQYVDNNDDESITTAREHMPSLRQLTRVIDQQLQQSRKASTRRNTMLMQPPPDSMSAIFTHNEHSGSQSNDNPYDSIIRSSIKTSYEKRVSILLTKPLQDDQITVEGSARVKLLVKSSLLDKQHPPPDLICFTGGLSGDNRVADADAAYIYFRHLCSRQKIPLKMPIHLERKSIDAALQQIVSHIQNNCVPVWLEEMERDDQPVGHPLSRGSAEAAATTTAAAAAATTTTAFSNNKSLKRKRKLEIQFSLISSEYHLCQLNDIHLRSPNQSALRVFSMLSKVSGVEAKWEYDYTTTAAATFVDSPLRAFCAKTYKTAQQLVPVLYNLRGVVNHQEFLQRDNYKVLVAARRSLVSDAEGMYAKQPSLQAVHQSLRDNVGDNCNSKPLDVVLESALLSLGRTLDLIRPAGLLTGSVPLEDFKRALTSLQQAYYLLDRACDPDVPLEPELWGDLDVEDHREADPTIMRSVL